MKTDNIFLMEDSFGRLFIYETCKWTLTHIPHMFLQSWVSVQVASPDCNVPIRLLVNLIYKTWGKCGPEVWWILFPGVID